MYEQTYGFSSKPFQINPDPGFFFEASGHRRALAYLRYGLQQGMGFVVVTGDIGTGKTLLVNTLFREIAGEKIVAARIVSSNVGDEDLLRLVAVQLGLPADNCSKGELLNRLEAFFRQCAEAGKRVLLVVDEAQNMPRSALEELRMLSNFEHHGQPLVQSFLLGQREFRDVLRAPGLEQLRQRVLAAFHLQPLTAAETEIYIRHRLGKVGWHGDPRIDDAVYPAVFAFTGGVPRRINTLMDRLLLNASLDSLHELDLAGVRAVTAEILAEQTIAPARTEAPAATAPTPAPLPRRAGNPGGEREDSLQQMEARLAAMQRAYDNLAESLATPAAAPVDQVHKPVRWWPRVVLASSALGLLSIGLFLLRHRI